LGIGPVVPGQLPWIVCKIAGAPRTTPGRSRHALCSLTTARIRQSLITDSNILSIAQWFSIESVQSARTVWTASVPFTCRYCTIMRWHCQWRRNEFESARRAATLTPCKNQIKLLKVPTKTSRIYAYEVSKSVWLTVKRTHKVLRDVDDIQIICYVLVAVVELWAYHWIVANVLLLTLPPVGHVPPVPCGVGATAGHCRQKSVKNSSTAVLNVFLHRTW